MHDQPMLNLLSALGHALVEYAASAAQPTQTSAPVAERAPPVSGEPTATPAPKSPRKAKAEPVPPEPKPEPEPAPAAAMTKEQFAAEATAVLQRHGGDQTPLTPLLASWGLTAPAQQLDPSRYGDFIAALKAAYGE